MSWRPEYIILIIASTLIDYISAIQISKSKQQIRKKLFLGLSLVVNLGLLLTFKYWNFFSESIREFLMQFAIQLSPATLNILLPVGISFYTFQTLSYTIDVYRGKIKPEKHLGIFAVYVSFFPQLVAGPIERAKHLLPQFYKKYSFEYTRVTNGLKLMLWGFFKKVVIADNLAFYVNPIYNDPTSFGGLPLLLATIFFAFQIYCDFSGYSDIAIGAAQVMGFSLMDNFKRPYFSRSIPEFWHRWHISLSTWFRDYVYIPLGGNKVSVPRWYINVFIVFLVSGLWHGANWTFLVWGLLHSIYFALSVSTKSIRTKIANFVFGKVSLVQHVLEVIITFILADLAWIFFRANTVQEGFLIIQKIFTEFSFGEWGATLPEIFFYFSLIGFLLFVHLLQEHMRMRAFLSNKPLVLRWMIYIIIIGAILLFGRFTNVEFIYFQF